MQILNNTRQLDIISIVGMPVVVNSTVINAAVVIQKGKVLGVAAKTYLPNYKEFYEQRWFTSALQLTEDTVRLCGQIVPIGANLLFETSDTTFGIEICERPLGYHTSQFLIGFTRSRNYFQYVCR